MYNNKFDYKELWTLSDENQELRETNQLLKEELINIFEKLTDPVIREKIFSLTDALIGGKPVITSGGGGGSDYDFCWDGRIPNLEKLHNRESSFRETSAAFVENAI